MAPAALASDNDGRNGEAMPIGPESRKTGILGEEENGHMRFKRPWLDRAGSTGGVTPVQSFDQAQLQRVTFNRNPYSP